MRPPVKDLFSKQSSLYAKFRPKYPDSLFKYLASLTTNHSLAWDVGTGNGQAAVEVANYYERVVATDRSAAQLAHAPNLPNITYALTPQKMTEEDAIKFVGEPGSVDLITVAQKWGPHSGARPMGILLWRGLCAIKKALHWFDFESFYSQARLLLRKPGGVFAAWTYGVPHISPPVDSVMATFYKTTHAFFEPQRRYIDENYETIPFYLEHLPPHKGAFAYESPAISQMTCDDYLGFLDSWSAVNTAREKGHDILNENVKAEFRTAWGDPTEVKDVEYPLYLLLGYAKLDSRTEN